MITSAEVDAIWSVVGKFGAIIAVIVALIKGMQYLKELTPTSKLEERVKVCEEHDKNDFEHFKEIDRRLVGLEENHQNTKKEVERINEGINRIGKSQISLLRHFVTGNGQAEMTKEADELTEYFIIDRGKDGK